MAEYIERNEAIRAIERYGTTNGCALGHHSGAVDCALFEIEAIPAADVEPVRHGRWKYYHKQNKAVCTNCSFERDLDANFGRAISCPNCGAKMDATDINVGDKEEE